MTEALQQKINTWWGNLPEEEREAAGKRFKEKYIPLSKDGCWLWIGWRDRKGYGGFSIRGKQIKAHRASWLFQKGSIPESMCVLHKCDVPSCVNPAHLFLGTPRDNYYDSVSKGRHTCGEKHGSAKLNEEQVSEIKALLVAGIVPRILAEQFGVSRRQISYIRSGENWSHIDAALAVQERGEGSNHEVA